MTKFQRWRLKNEMLVANFLANFIGAVVVQKLIVKAETSFPESLFENPLLLFFDIAFTPCAFIFVTVATLIYERSIVMSISTGIITVTVAFFLLEHILQERLAPHFFPDGGLHKIPRTLRIRIRKRLTALLFACNLIPLFSILQIIDQITGNVDNPATAIKLARSAIFTNGLIFIAVGIILTVRVSRNLALPFGEIIQSLRNVRNGNFDKKIQVTTNDEIGYTGDVINEMTEGLKERDRMRQSLSLAMDVQQHLLPQSNPETKGLDIAGESIYCEETGGDYYDYLEDDKNGQGKIKVVVGDVSDHGIPSALLMTTAWMNSVTRLKKKTM